MVTGQSLRDLALRGSVITGVRIIDVHGHLGRWNRVHIFRPDPSDLVADMDSIGIDTICVSALLPIMSGDYSGNDLVGRAVREFPGRFIGYAVPNPNYPETIVPELERCFDRLGHRAVKLHPACHAYPAGGPAYEPALAFANERRAWALSHSWDDPATLERCALKYPEATFIIAHFASPKSGIIPDDGWVRLVRDLPNVYAETAYSVAPMGGFEDLVGLAGSGKVLFGSDAPITDPGAQIGRILLARIPDAHKCDILGNNMARIMRLGGSDE